MGGSRVQRPSRKGSVREARLHFDSAVNRHVTSPAALPTERAPDCDRLRLFGMGVADLQQFAGVAAASASSLASGVYTRDVLDCRVRPHRVTWWALSLLNAAIAASYHAAGASNTIWLPLEFAVSALAVAVLSLRYGDGFWRFSDTCILVGALLGITFWWLMRSAPWALAVFIAVDFLALLPTMIKV